MPTQGQSDSDGNTGKPMRAVSSPRSDNTLARRTARINREHHQTNATFTPLPPSARFGAALLDGVLLFSTATIVVAVTAFLLSCDPARCLANPIAIAGAFGAVSLYFVAFWTTRMATPGMSAMRAIILDARTGADPGVVQYLKRYLGLLLSCAALGLGFVSIFKSPLRQAFHDKFSGTLVVRQREIRNAAYRPLQWRFYALCAVVAAIVIPLFIIAEGVTSRVKDTVTALANAPVAFLPDDVFETLCLHDEPAPSPELQEPGRELIKARKAISDAQGRRSLLEIARATLNAQLEETPCDPRIYREYARYFSRISQIDVDGAPALKQAMTAIDRAIALSPSYADAYVLKGFIEHMSGDNTRASEMLETAQRLGTTDPWLHINRALIARSSGNLSAAAIEYRKVIDHPTTDRNAILAAIDGIADYFVYSGDLEGAKDVFAKRIDFEPESALGHFKYARFLLCYLDDTERSLLHAQKASDFGLNTPHLSASDLLAANYARRWAKYVNKGGIAAQRMAPKNLALAESVGEGKPIDMIAALCPSGPAFDQVAHATLKQADPDAPATPIPHIRDTSR
jgi:uncharacterized RDD family membrane protein YckC/tetratricopeptide (TPR) repeat protein